MLRQLGPTLFRGEFGHVTARLDDRERQIIRYGYALDSDREPMTLKALGSAMSLTKERIRQLAARAIVKLRRAAVDLGLDVLEDRPAGEPRLDQPEGCSNWTGSCPP